MRTSATVLGLMLIAALGVGVTSCAKGPPDSEASPAGEQNISSWEEIRLYWGAVLDRYGRPRRYAQWPHCEYVTLRWVSTPRSYTWPRLARLKRAVWHVGGDAAVRVTRRYESDGHETWFVYEGLAIRFTDPECTH